MRFLRVLFLLAVPFFLFNCQTTKQKKDNSMNPIVTIYTNQGNIQIELYPEKAPLTVKNFLTYVDEKFYDDTIFHRVIDGFMIQGGGMDADFKEKSTHSAIRNEADNRLANTEGTIAMARTSDVHSATAQFYINVADNHFLDYRNPTPSGYGYCVFGQVISGMETVYKIKSVKTTDQKGHQNVPVQAVKILEIKRS